MLSKGMELLDSHFSCENCCEYCGKNCPFLQPCSPQSFCVNCNIPGNLSLSWECPKS